METGSRAARAAWLMLLGAAGVPATLLWDFSWESTIGVERFFAPPHSATYLAIAGATCAALQR